MKFVNTSVITLLSSTDSFNFWVSSYPPFAGDYAFLPNYPTFITRGAPQLNHEITRSVLSEDDTDHVHRSHNRRQ